MKRGWLAAVAAVGLYGAAIGAMRGWEAHHPVTEYLSVPPASTIRTLGAGFDNMAANGLYLQFVNYFGKHVKGDRTYHNVWPVLNAITDLDPQFRGAYHLGSLALGDDHRMDEMQQLMAKRIKAFPGDWQAAYDAGMAIFLFAETPKDYDLAARYFKMAADLPGAEPRAAFMLARSYHVSNRQDLVRAIWLDLYKRSPDAEARAVAARSLQRLGVRLSGEKPGVVTQ